MTNPTGSIRVSPSGRFLKGLAGQVLTLLADGVTAVFAPNPGGSGAYQTVSDDGAVLPQEPVLDIVNGTLADEVGVATHLTLQYQQIEDSDGLQLPRQLGTHYNAELLVTDDPAIGCTRVRAPGIAVAQAAADAAGAAAAAAQGTANGASAAAAAAQTTANARLSSFDGRTAIAASDVVASLAALGTLAGSVSGSRVFVLDQGEVYVLDTANAFAVSSPLIVAAAGGGNWFRRSKAYVVGTFTLWAAPFSGASGTGDAKLGGFTPGQITASNAAAPNIILDLVADWPLATATITGMVTDSLGNLWVVGYTNGAGTAFAVKKYLLKDILASGSPSAVVSVAGTSGVVNAVICAFDKQNNLWCLLAQGGQFGAASLQKFSQSSYSVSGSPRPDVALTMFNPGVLAPATSDAEAMCFDAAGNLWIGVGTTFGAANQGGILMLGAPQLLVNDAAVVPSVFWAGSNFQGSGNLNIVGIAFGNGLIWAAQFTGNKVFAYDPRAPVSGNPAPLITLTSATFNGPISLCFDSGGNLWVANDNNSRIYRIPVASLGASGAVVPDIILSQATILSEPIQITFPNNPGHSGLLASGLP